MANITVSQSGIYCIRNLVSDRHYVGSGKRISGRWKSHRHLLRQGRHHSLTLQRSWNKHGEEAFSFDVLELVDDLTQLVVREQFWIDKLHAADPKRGFNVSPTAGNCLGMKHGSEMKAKISAIHKGRAKSPDHRRAIGNAQRGKIIPEEQRQQLADATRRHFAENPEARERMREVGRRNGAASKGRVMSADIRARNSEAQKRSEKARAAVKRNLRPPTLEIIKMGNARAAEVLTGQPRQDRRSLSFYQAEQIRALKIWGATYDELETIFGINRSGLFSLIKGRTYQLSPPGERSPSAIDLSVHIQTIRRMRAGKPTQGWAETRGTRRSITFNQAQDVRALKAGGMTYSELEERFGLNRASLCNIVKGRTYREPSPDEPTIAKVTGLHPAS